MQQDRTSHFISVYDIISEGYQRESVTEIPPKELISLVIGTSDQKAYVEVGKSVYLDFSLILLKYFNKTWADFNSILDFGVGSGRIARWLPACALGKLIGVDPNEAAVKWCSENLVGNYKSSLYLPPLNIEDSSVDLTYSFSVFSHMNTKMTKEWVNELWRITIPGGILLITTHLSWASKSLLNDNELESFYKNGFYYREYVAEEKEMHDTSVYINSFMRENYFFRLWEDKFELIGITGGNKKYENIPHGWCFDKPEFDMGQAVLILRKK